MIIYLIKLKALIMKKFTLILIASIGISFSLSAQTAGDYRSVGNGNWNDPTKWERYNGSTWVSTTTYPGQNSGSGAVTIKILNEIMLTATVPNPIASLLIDQLYDYPAEGSVVSQNGIVVFSSENPVSLRVSGDVAIHGELRIDDQNGTKTHTLFVGAYFEVGTPIYDIGCGGQMIPATFQTIDQDDKLGVVFTGSTWINTGPNGITFQDVTFDGTGFSVTYPVYIKGTATFINGIVGISNNLYGGQNCTLASGFNGEMVFYDGATVSGASNASFVEGWWVSKVGDDPFTFPIGGGNVYAPLTISAPASQTASVQAYYQRTNASEIGTISDPGLFSVSSCELWWLNAYGLNNNLDVTISWSAASSCGSSPYIANVSEVTLARFSDQGWSSHGGSGIGTPTNGSVTWNGVNNFGFFTFGNLDACNAPWEGSVTNITSNSAILNWSVANGAVGYDVDYKKYNSSEWINATTSTASTSVTLSGLSALTNYTWRVRSKCSSGSSSYRQAQFTTITDCGTPSGLSATNISPSSVALSWTSVTGAVSYELQYKLSYGSTWTSVAGIISLPTYNLSGLWPVETYDWRVRANCSSSPSVYIQGQFQTANPCATPTGLVTSNITSSSVTLNWNAVPNNSQFNVQYKQSNSSVWVNAVAGFTYLTYQLAGLSASTSYDWRVIAHCYYAPTYTLYGSYAAHASFTTLQTPPPPPPVCYDVYESNNSSNQAKAISFGNAISAGIASTTDIDWFKVTTPNNSNTNLEVTLSSLPADYDLYVYNKSLKLIGSSTNSGTSNEVVIFNSSARKATYYIKVVGKNGAYNSQCYNLLAQVSSSARSASGKSDPANKVTGISDKQLLYPNPASEFVMLHFNSIEEGPVNVEIFNTAGQLVKKSAIKITKGYNQVKISVNDIRQGIYLLSINKGELNIIRKFVITR
jgi:hypothetical protein